jgi:hypothetical protein
MMRVSAWSRAALIAGLAATGVSLSAPSDARETRHRSVQARHKAPPDLYRPLRIGIGLPTRPLPRGELLCPRPGDPDATCRTSRGGSVALVQPPSPLQPLGSSTLRPPDVPSPDPNQVFVPTTIDSSGSIRPARYSMMPDGWARGAAAGFSVSPYLRSRPCHLSADADRASPRPPT